MELWKRLYTMIWIAFIEFLLVFTAFAFPATRLYLVSFHVVLGLAIIWLSYGNFMQLLASKVPGRVKRIAKSTFQMAISAAGIGALMGAFVLAGLDKAFALPVIGVTVYNVFQFLHVVIAFAIITQASATAIGYDMWEEREWEKETEPGEVPPNPAMKPSAQKT